MARSARSAQPGFLCEAFVYLTAEPGLTTKDAKTLQKRTFYGKEKNSLAYVIAIMNMILHGIEAPNIIHTNTLTENLADIQDKDRFDVVMANPPFGGNERKEVQQNFSIHTGESRTPPWTAPNSPTKLVRSPLIPSTTSISNPSSG